MLYSLPPGSYLAIGAGNGYMLDLADVIGMTQCRGIEFREEFKKKRQDVIFCPRAELPFLDNEYDYVSMFYVLETLSEEYVSATLSEANRIANGAICIRIHNFPFTKYKVDEQKTIKSFDEWHQLFLETFSNGNVERLPRAREHSEGWLVKFKTLQEK